MKTFVLVACIAGLPLPAGAATLYDNGAPNHLGGSDMVLSFEANDFVLPAPSTLITAQFWDFETPGGSDYAGSIFWNIYTNSSNKPGSVLFSGAASGGNVTRISTGFLDASAQFAEYSDTFTFGTGVSLGAGTYWLVLHNGSALNVNPNSLANFAWETTTAACQETSFNVCGRAQDLTVPASPFLSTLTENAYNLSGTTVPEPGSLLLFGAGLLGLVLWTRRSAAAVA